MTDQQPHPLTTAYIRDTYAKCGSENELETHTRDAEFNRWLAARDARIKAAAEQRGAVKALLKAADAIRGNRLPSGNEHTELCDNCSIAAADHLLDRADRIADKMEGDE